MDSQKPAAKNSSSNTAVAIVSATGFLVGGLAGLGIGRLSGSASELSVIVFYIVGAIAGTAVAAAILRARKRKAVSR